MKTFKIKNYKGNIIESLKKFSESHKGMKIVQTYLEGDDLKILAKELENINEAISNSVFAVMVHDDDKFKTILGIGSSEKEAQKIIDNAKGWEHAKGNMKIVKLDLNREIDYSLYGLDFSESKSVVKEDEADANLAVEHGAKYFEALAKALEMTFSEDVNNNEESFEVWKELLRFIDEKQIAITPSEEFNRKFDLIAAEFDNALAKL